MTHCCLVSAARAVLLAMFMAVVLAGSLAAPAAAATRTTGDPRADAPARFDLTRVTYTNGTRALTTEARLRDLRQQATKLVVVFQLATHSELTFRLISVNQPGQPVRNRVLVRNSEGTFRWPCSRREITATWLPRRDTVRIVMQQSCMGEPHPGRLLMHTVTGRPGTRSIDSTRTLSVPH